ncbi:hypothetical protein I552_5237 [Mycobacterium xenopi 3993]|nr:hypothetical protein I552_5237 [Mycobacterium xenopi 3993]
MSGCSPGCCYTPVVAGKSGGCRRLRLQAAALGLGSVLLVQALLVTALLFALPINARVTRRRMTRREWTWAALLAVAVAIVVTVGHPSAVTRAPRSPLGPSRSC